MTRKTINLRRPYSNDETPGDTVISFDHYPKTGRTILSEHGVSPNRMPDKTLMVIPDHAMVPFVMRLVSSGSPQVRVDTEHTDYTAKFEFSSYGRHQMGRGCVGIRITQAERDEGRYDDHTVLIHQNAESEDPAVMRTVEFESALLAQLLNKFRINVYCLKTVADARKENA